MRDTAQTARSGSTWAPGGLLARWRRGALDCGLEGHGIPSLAASPHRAGKSQIADCMLVMVMFGVDAGGIVDAT